jgi:hypothetical protein
MKTFLFRLWQWTWGFPQTLLGAMIWLLHRKNPQRVYHGCIVTRWNQSGSLGVGMFLFLSQHSYDSQPQVQVHEFGHAVQSAILGPLFLPVMGIPSFLWCNLPVCRKLRKEKGISYYAFYPESTANRLGSLVAKEVCLL